MSNNKNKSSNKNAVAFEGLENRQMMAGNPLTTGTVAYNGGTQLVVTGTNYNDSIGISQVTGGVLLTNGKWSTTVAGNFNSVSVLAGRGNDVVTVNRKTTLPAFIYGGLGNDTINGGAGHDKLYGQGGTDVVYGNGGNDTIVSVGDATNDLSYGGDNDDSFWVDATEKTDATTAETKAGNFHKVTAFNSYNTTSRGVVRTNRVSTNLSGDNLADPLVTKGVTYTNFSKNPLFGAAGPTADDIAQGYVGDCWYLASLSAIAKANPNAIRQSVVELGDGTYAVQFANANGTKAFVRVDGDLPTNGYGMEYADLGKNNSVWVAIMEKAYATFREQGAVANYANLDGGWMDEAFADLGMPSFSKWSSSNADELLNWLAAELDAGRAVTLAINTAKNGAPVIGCHAYSVAAVETSSNGTRTLVLRNPWGIDGAGNDGKNDGYVRLNATQALNSTWAAISAKV
ncbi:MAG TPA: C2 family cysteine protease [Tepidisphaeraceae bacterium]|nr:C2 family cysteine protease [Tepidisphaeraceae bacterium]